MQELLSWVSAEGPGYTLWMRNTPTVHGVIISPFGNYMGEPELSSRRYSVCKQYPDGSFVLEIGSIAYTEGYDTDDPLEPIDKYLNGEFDALMRVDGSDTAGMTSVEDWDGSGQALVNLPWN